MRRIRPKNRSRLRPTNKIEKDIQSAGYPTVAGVDEVGRGSLAGPVVAAAVLLRPGSTIRGVRDSKLLNDQRRERLSRTIKQQALAVGLGWVGHDEINQHGLTWAICQ